jgi:hypothetical protein
MSRGRDGARISGSESDSVSPVFFSIGWISVGFDSKWSQGCAAW